VVLKLAAVWLSVLSRFGLPLPRPIATRVRRLESHHKSSALLRSLFESRQLSWDSNGFWLIDPMPSKSSLDDFYAQTYWSSRSDSQSLLRSRDVDHFVLLEPFLQDVRASTQKVAMNFGSGHGGCSFLFRAAGFEVWNVDPAENELEAFRHASSISQVPLDLDLVYASHSLEHVTDPIATTNEIVDHLGVGGLFFVEVPNARRTDEIVYRESERAEPPIHPPHTVYYTTDFFRSLGLKTLILDTFSYSDGPFAIATASDDAEVIRYLGQKVV